MNNMANPLDLDQLRTFAVIADCGSFTEAARRVFKTQSAVSMQIKRLEERLGEDLLVRDGRSISLTRAGDALYHHARRMLEINAEIEDLFSSDVLSGTIRIGIPDDYAVKVLPILLSSFQQTHPKILVDVKCKSSEELIRDMQQGDYDLIVFTQGTNHETGELLRTEPLSWVIGPNSDAHLQDPLPIACGNKQCCWRTNAESALRDGNINYRVAYTSSNATAITSAVMSGLAVGVLAESSITPEMRKLGVKDGLPPLKAADIAIRRAANAYGGIYSALVAHIKSELDQAMEDAA
jgi:DNA-binding transcriptional LysR family regulator